VATRALLSSPVVPASQLPSIHPGDQVGEGGAIQAVADPLMLAPAKVPFSRTFPLFLRQATAAMISALLAAKALMIWTRSKSGHPRGGATVVTSCCNSSHPSGVKNGGTVVPGGNSGGSVMS
jgi:hypothetical protein